MIGGATTQHLERKMTDLDELAARAWRVAVGDAPTAIWLLRNGTGLGLREALTVIQRTAVQVGGQCNVSIVGRDELKPEVAKQLAPRSIAERRATQPAEHRAARGVKKVRGSKEITE